MAGSEEREVQEDKSEVYDDSHLSGLNEQVSGRTHFCWWLIKISIFTKSDLKCLRAS